MTDVTNGPLPGAETTTTEVSHRSRSSIGAGIMLLALGALFFVDRLGWDWGWTWHPTFDRMWPVLLIVVGLVKISSWPEVTTVTVTNGTGTRTVTRHGRTGGGFWILIVGVIMLLHQNGWLTLDQSWPLFIMAAGVAVLLGRGGRRRYHRGMF